MTDLATPSHAATASTAAPPMSGCRAVPTPPHRQGTTRDDQPPHILTISEVAEDCTGGRGHEIECPGVTDACRLWITCTQNEELDRDLDEDVWRLFAHGVEHQRIDERWMVRTESCFVRDNEELGEAVEELHLPPGRHPVDFDAGGDGCDLQLIVLTTTPTGDPTDEDH